MYLQDIALIFECGWCRPTFIQWVYKIYVGSANKVLWFMPYLD